MKRCSATLALAGALVLAACGGSGDDGPQVSVQDQAAGRYAVSLGRADAPTWGKYYAAENGKRLLVAFDADERAQQLYRRTDGSARWVAVPEPDADTDVALLRSDTLSQQTLAVASMAGRYVTRTPAGAAASFSIDANGAIVAGSSACKLSGTLSAGSLPSTLNLALRSSGCGDGVPGRADGVLVVDSDDAPAAFRLLADGDGQLADFWAFAD